MTQTNKNPNVLNLDEITPVVRTITYQGKDYSMRQVTVAEFIEASRKVDELQEEAASQEQGEGKMSEGKLFDGFIDVIAENFPGLTREILEGMSLNHLMHITIFITQEGQDQAEAAAQKK